MVAVAALSVVAFSLVWSGTAKLHFPRASADTIGAHAPRLATPSAIATLGVLEAALGTGLIAAACLVRSAAAVAAAAAPAIALLLIFGAALLRSHRRGVRAPCGCFGVPTRGSALTKSQVVRPFALTGLVVAGTVMFLASTPPERTAALGLAVGGSCCLVALVYEVASTFRSDRDAEDAISHLITEAA